MALYYLILWNQVDILQKHLKIIMSIRASGRGFTVCVAFGEGRPEEVRSFPLQKCHVVTSSNHVVTSQKSCGILGRYHRTFW